MWSCADEKKLSLSLKGRREKEKDLKFELTEKFNIFILFIFYNQTKIDTLTSLSLF